ncbi:MAD2L1-binding protein [Chelonus insularis]|uniref:MAD2L1-binding protein n=1 Tax=Chelonus insularis TaxID=460826 RepID=UPI00158954AE|nr:MAD2L1-binding protein [Chelonus insularis]
MFSQEKYNKNTSIDIKLNEPLTSDSCSKIIVELIKYILYQKQQIPFAFDTLVQLGKGKPADRNFSSTKTLQNSLNNLTHQLSSQLHLAGCNVKEVVVIIGATTISPKFCLKVELPSQILSSEKHIEYQHSYRKPLLTLMKSLIECSDFQQAIATPLSVTNTFVLVKKSDSNPKSEFFLPKPQYYLPVQISCFSIKLFYNEDDFNSDCTCSNIVKVYNDNQLDKTSQTTINIDNSNVTCMETNVPYIWYQSKEVVKGFKFFR